MEFAGDDLLARELAARLGLPRVAMYSEVGSTLDVAHDLAAAGAPMGTLVVADAQTAGRGRHGRHWRSAPGAGLWLTLLARPRDSSALEVLSLRTGLVLARALDAFTDATVRLKWPNDLYLDGRKLGGILVEARWREGQPEWIAVGVGINIIAPAGEPRAIGLRPGVDRWDLLAAVAPALRDAADVTGLLSRDELDEFARRDVAAGERCTAPVPGIVRGIDATGALLVDVGSGTTAVRAGSLALSGDR